MLPLPTFAAAAPARLPRAFPQWNKVSFRVHGLVKNTNDYQLILCFTIKDNVLADKMRTQALADNTAWGA